MTLLKIWIHFVFSTKNRELSLTDEARQQLVKYMRSMTRDNKIYLDHLSVLDEHFHCLISLGKEQTISQVAGAISNNTAEWLNTNGFAPKNFSWDDYYAVSVSESQVDDVRRYIRNQEKYHKHKSFEEELQEFHKRYGWKKTAGVEKKSPVADTLDYSDLDFK